MIKLTSDAINYIKLFETRTGAIIKDCIINNEGITIIVKEGNLGLVIGKKGAIINKIKKEIGKEVHAYEYSEDLPRFIANLLFPIKVEKVEINEKEAKLFIKQSEKKRAIGRGGKKIKNVKEIVLRHFPVENIVIA